MKYDVLKYGDKELTLHDSLTIELALCSQIRNAMEHMKAASGFNDAASFSYWVDCYVQYSNALAAVTTSDMFKAYLDNIQTEVGTL